ncbi:cytochrome P450 2C14-like [Anomaloglossus baeobatrachus]
MQWLKEVEWMALGKPFNNLRNVNSAVANIIVSILLSERYDYENPTILKLVDLINENTRLFGSPLVRRKDLDANDQRNLIDAYLVKQKEEKPESTQYYSNGNLLALVTDLFIAGIESTSTTLRWGLLLMMKYPEIQEKVQKEIERVIGSTQPHVEHRKQMPYTGAVIHEIQRFGDIVPGNLPHVTSQDVTFRGYFIPEGTVVIPLLHSVLKDKTCFKKADEFYPEHFLDSSGNFLKNEAFIPFSLGHLSALPCRMGPMGPTVKTVVDQ